jgi:methionyl-tRNA formyltransferase
MVKNGVKTAPRADAQRPIAPFGPPLRIAFFGTPAFAVPTLDALVASRHQVVGVVTQPDRPRGRGQKTSDAPVKARAVAAPLPILQPERLKDPAFVDAFAAWQADLAVVAAYGRILPESLLAMPRLGMINVHASILPRYRGAAPVHRAIIAGERETGVTIMRVVKALDAGPMLARARRSIAPDETSETVEADLAQMGASLLLAVVDRLSEGRAEERAQDDSEATYAHRLTKEDGAIDWSQPADRIHNLVRGLHPWPHAYSYIDERRYIVLRSEPLLDEPSNQLPGTVTEVNANRLTVATGNGRLRILELQVEGKRPMGIREFVAGHRLEPGSRFAPR